MISKKVASLILRKFVMEHDNLIQEIKKLASNLENRNQLYNKIVNYEMEYYNSMNNNVGKDDIFILKNGTKFLNNLNGIIEKEKVTIQHLEDNMKEYAKHLMEIDGRIKSMENILDTIQVNELISKESRLEKGNRELLLLRELRG